MCFLSDLLLCSLRYGIRHGIPVRLCGGLVVLGGHGAGPGRYYLARHRQGILSRRFLSKTASYECVVQCVLGLASEDRKDAPPPPPLPPGPGGGAAADVETSVLVAGHGVPIASRRRVAEPTTSESSKSTISAIAAAAEPTTSLHHIRHCRRRRPRRLLRHRPHRRLPYHIRRRRCDAAAGLVGSRTPLLGCSNQQSIPRLCFAGARITESVARDVAVLVTAPVASQCPRAVVAFNGRCVGTSS